MRFNNRFTRFAIAMGVLSGISSQIPFGGGTALADDYPISNLSGNGNNQGLAIALGLGLVVVGTAVLTKRVGTGGGDTTDDGSIILHPGKDDKKDQDAPPTTPPDTPPATPPATPPTDTATLVSQVAPMTSAPGSTVSVATSSGQIVSVANNNGSISTESTGSGDDSSSGSSSTL